MEGLNIEAAKKKANELPAQLSNKIKLF